MQFKLENPQHQITSIQSVVEVFRGMERNTLCRYKSVVEESERNPLGSIFCNFAS